MKRVVILQPSYIPWLGYFDQMKKADAFVFYDDVQYTRRDWRNRNRIKASDGIAIYLTAPVKNKGNYFAPINEIQFADESFREKHVQIIKTHYKNAKAYDSHFPTLKEILAFETPSLADYTTETTMRIAQMIGITNTQFFRSSSFHVQWQNSTDHLIQICKHLNASHYLTGASARAYLDEQAFGYAGIKLEYQDYAHPVYTQLHGTFIPYLSIVDFLLNEGDATKNILLNNV